MKKYIVILMFFTSIYHANFIRRSGMFYPYHQYNPMNIYNPIVYHIPAMTHQPIRCTILQANGKTITVESEYACRGR